MATPNLPRATVLEHWLAANPITVNLLQKALAWVAASSVAKHLIEYLTNLGRFR
jgi:hypothetical protein